MLHKQQIAGILFTAGLALGQSGLTFEVASVRRLESSTGRFTMNGGPGTSDPTRITYANVPLRRVLLEAYPVSNYQLTGPDWLNTLRYDISAKVAEGTSKEQFQTMLQNLLITRFQMAIRRESREVSVYALLVGKNGLKLSISSPDGKPVEDQLATVQSQEGKDGFPVISMKAPGIVIETRNGTARMTAKDVTLAKLAEFLTGQVGRPVLDKTELPGIYSFNLYFTPEGASTSDSPEPAIYAALQQELGLRLEARKAPVEFLVVDHAEKIPTGN
ncbi:MAG TPA: TIGR03435 family protein [Bryobacteraceae bacterium]|nr:TIGR03435 family protein [Bryobacteraceae bacterium]